MPPTTLGAGTYEEVVREYVDNSMKWQRFIVEARKDRDEALDRAEAAEKALKEVGYIASINVELNAENVELRKLDEVRGKAMSSVSGAYMRSLATQVSLTKTLIISSAFNVAMGVLWLVNHF